MINLRNALMAGTRLPYDAEVEYLQSTGTQWIDTGVYGNSDTVAELTFAMTDNSRSDAGIFGSRKGYMQDCFTVLRVQSSNGAFWMHYGNEGTNANYISTVIGNTTAWHTARLARSWSIDTSTGTAGQYTFTTPTTLKVFAADMSASGRWFAKMRLASLKIYSNNLLVRDYIPVRKGTVGYLYDRVSGKLFGNAGTGDFVLGADVVPVEYIESHGAEYINTGYIPTMATKWVADMQWTSTAWLQVTGIRNGVGSQQSRFAIGRDNSSYGNGWLFATGNIGNWVGTFDTNRHTFAVDMPNGTASIDATSYSTGATALSTTGTVIFMARRNTSGVETFVTGRLFGSQFFDNGILSRNYKPIRVGTDATSWEGAMMDVLTRRIYRNAGIGAFGYGNDLKYPIPAA